MENTQGSRKIVFIICAIGYFLANLDESIVYVVIPAVSKDFNINVFSAGNILVVFIFAYGLTIPLGSYLSDRFGIKKVFISATVLFGLSSLLCGLSTNIHILELARGVQGASGALFTPVMRSIIVKYSPKDRIVTNVSNILSFGMIAQFIGPFAGAQIVRYFTWKLIFLVNVPICLVIISLSIYHLKNIKIDKCNSFDLFSFIAVTASLFLFLYACGSISIDRTDYYKVIILLLSSILIFILYLFYSRKNPVNIIDTNLFRNIVFRNSIIAYFIASIGIGELSFSLMLILSYVYNLNASQIGNLILFYGIGLWIGRWLMPILLKYLLVEILCFYSSWGMLISVLLLVPLAIFKSILSCSILFIICGIISSIFFGCINGFVLRSVETSESNQASAILSLSSYISKCSSVSMINILVIFMYLTTTSYQLSFAFILIIQSLFILAAIPYIYKILKPADVKIILRKA